MGIFSVIEVALGLLSGVASTLHKQGLSDIAVSVENAIAELQKVHGSDVTKAQLEGLRLDSW